MRPRPASDLRHRDGIRPSLLLVSLLALAVLPLGRNVVGQVAPGQQPGNQETIGSSNDIIPGVVVVKLKRPGAVGKGMTVQNEDAVIQTFSKCGVTSVKRAFPHRMPLSDAAVAAGKVDLSQIHYATIPSNLNPREVAAQLAAMPGVEYAEPKYRYYLCSVPNDSNYVEMQKRYYDLMHVEAGWDLQKGSADVVIAAVDGGTNWQHPDLADNIWINPAEDINHSGAFEPLPPPTGDLNGFDDDGNTMTDDVVGWNFGNNTSDPRGFLAGLADHGTETASGFGAVANNGRGIAGTSWNCRIMPVCASDPVEQSITEGFAGIEYAARMGARVINCSWSRPGGPYNFSESDQEVITWAADTGALVVAAAGNNHHQDSDILPYYPACYQHVLSVGAITDTSDEIAPFTNIGLNVSVFAPGTRIFVAKDNGSYGVDSGTSHSTPLVAGLAGLLFAKHPDWTPDMVAEQIRMTADPIDAVNADHAGSLGHGVVNFERALSEVHSGVIVVAGHFDYPSGRPFFQEGDLVVLTAKIKNVLTVAAENLWFDVSASSGLTPISSVVGPQRLDSGAEDSVHCYLRVGDLACKTVAKVRLYWHANADDWDARMFNVTLYEGGGFWEWQKSPTSIPLFSVSAVSNRVAWATGLIQNSSYTVVVRTTDGGENWAIVNGDLTGYPISIAAVDSLRAWVGGGNGQIFATVDGGVSWTLQDYPAPKSGLIKYLRFLDAANGFALGERGTTGRFVILATTDGGATWTHLANEPEAVSEDWYARAFCCTDKQHLWLGTPNSLIWRTSDGGNTWSSVSLGAGSVSAIEMRDSVGLLCAQPAPGYGQPIIARTSDGGATWHPLPGLKTDGGWSIAMPAGSTNAWVVGARTVYASRDNGVTWKQQPPEPSDDISSVSFSDPTHGWMVTWEGEIFQYQDLPTKVKLERQDQLPLQFVLEQNYPNPFNPLTIIHYTVGGIRGSQLAPVHRNETLGLRASEDRTSGLAGRLGASNIKLIVYDLLGREVTVLVDERKVPGSYEVSFDGSGLASGVYIYRLTAGSFVQCRKMVLLR